MHFQRFLTVALGFYDLAEPKTMHADLLEGMWGGWLLGGGPAWDHGRSVDLSRLAHLASRVGLARRAAPTAATDGWVFAKQWTD